MVDANGMLDDRSTPTRAVDRAQRAEEIDQKTSELAKFRDAGVLTEAEFQEQKAKVRWGIK
jgi:putative oligomerization/nucleic acid binding protein